MKKKAFDKIQHPFMIKTLQKMGIRETQGKVTVGVYSHRAGVGRPLQRGFKSCF